ncbi:hypothetical protein DNTS_004424 [Danionella cerebrum]|uniref:Ras-GAP domain-containing protein n=1 Tax=Danionella cerebrum TaxID=2873325 RepID=A0A553NHA7_9TELE|nr:hypothetical protein DNTS_004424 [Danionella translucida]
MARTATVWKNLNPFWGEEYTLHLPTSFHTLAFYVMDEDTISHDDVIGKISLTKDAIAAQHKGLDGWLNLRRVCPDEEIQGEIRLALNLNRDDKRLSCRVIEARDLAPRDISGTSDPFTRIIYNNLNAETSIIKKTRFPRWDETLELCLEEAGEEHSGVIIVEVWDWDMVGKNDFLGKHKQIIGADCVVQVEIPVSRLLRSGPLQGWFRLMPLGTSGDDAGGKLGALRLNVRLMEERILPSVHYQPLMRLMLDAVISPSEVDEVTPLTLLEQVTTAESRQEVAMTLVKIYLGQGLCVPFLDRLNTREVQNTKTNLEVPMQAEHRHQVTPESLPGIDGACGSKMQFYFVSPWNTSTDKLSWFSVSPTADPNTLFRSNSLASKAMEQFMKAVGMLYLHQVLKPIIDRIFEEKKYIELDPCKINRSRRISFKASGSESEIRESSVCLLQSYLSSIMEAITSSVSQCPSIMRLVFKQLHARVQQRFPHIQHQDVKYLAISGFFFLRLFAPAILTPKLFHLRDQHADTRTSRTLLLLAKALQSVGNLGLQLGHGKEQWMSPLHPSILCSAMSVRGFLDKLIDIDHNSDSESYCIKNHSRLTVTLRGSVLPESRQRSVFLPSVVLREGFLQKHHNDGPQLLKRFTFKKRYFWLSSETLSFAKSPDCQISDSLLTHCSSIPPSAHSVTSIASLTFSLQHISSSPLASPCLCLLKPYPLCLFPPCGPHIPANETLTRLPYLERSSIPVSSVCAVERVEESAFQLQHVMQLITQDTDGESCTTYLQCKVNTRTAVSDSISAASRFHSHSVSCVSERKRTQSVAVCDPKALCLQPTHAVAVSPGSSSRKQVELLPAAGALREQLFSRVKECSSLSFSAVGCCRTHPAVTLSDWSDPLEPDAETQIIYKELLQSRDALRALCLETQGVGSVKLEARSDGLETLCMALIIFIQHKYVFNDNLHLCTNNPDVNCLKTVSLLYIIHC